MRVIELIQYHFEQNKIFFKNNDYRNTKNFRLFLLLILINFILASILFFNSQIEQFVGIKINKSLNVFLIFSNLFFLIIIEKKFDNQMEEYFKARKIKFLIEYPTYLKEKHKITRSNELEHLITLLKEHNSHNYNLKTINIAILSLTISVIGLILSVVPLSLKMTWFIYLLVVFVFVLFINIYLQQRYNFRIFPKRKKISELISILEEIQLSFLIKENQKNNDYLWLRSFHSKNHRIRRKKVK